VDAIGALNRGVVIRAIGVAGGRSVVGAAVGVEVGCPVLRDGEPVPQRTTMPGSSTQDPVLVL